MITESKTSKCERFGEALKPESRMIKQQTGKNATTSVWSEKFSLQVWKPISCELANLGRGEIINDVRHNANGEVLELLLQILYSICSSFGIGVTPWKATHLAAGNLLHMIQLMYTNKSKQNMPSVFHQYKISVINWKSRKVPSLLGAISKLYQILWQATAASCSLPFN